MEKNYFIFGLKLTQNLLNTSKLGYIKPSYFHFFVRSLILFLDIIVRQKQCRLPIIN